METRSRAMETLEELSFHGLKNDTTGDEAPTIDEDTAPSLIQEGLEKDALKKHLMFRQKLLSRLCDTKSQEEMKLLITNEKVFCSEVLALASADAAATKDKLEKVAQDKAGETDTKDPSQERPKKKSKQKDKTDRSIETVSKKAPSSILARVYRQVVFDVRYAIPGVAGILVYCFAHLACFDLFNTIVSESTKHYKNWDHVQLVVLALGLVLARLSGGIWHWASQDIQDELKKLRKQKSKEFQRMELFKKNKRLRQVVNIAYFYLCFVSVCYFYQFRLMAPLDMRKTILEGLPSVKQGETTQLSNHVLKIEPGFLVTAQRRELVQEENDVVCNETLFEVDLTTDDDEYLYSSLSFNSYTLLIGEAETILVTPMASLLYAFSISLVGILMLKKLDISFWE